MLPKRLRYLQTYNLDFGSMAAAHTMKLTQGMIGGGCGGPSKAQVITESAFNFAELIAMASIAGKAEKNSAQAATMQKTNGAMGALVQAQTKVTTIEKTIDVEKGNLGKLEGDLKTINNAATLKKGIDDKLAALEKQCGNDGQVGNVAIQHYDQVNAELTQLKGVQSEIKAIDQQMPAAEARFDAAKGASFTSRGKEAKNITLDANGKASPLDTNNYNTIEKKDDRGNVSYEFDQASYDIDAGKAKAMENEFQAAKKGVDDLKTQKDAKLKNAGTDDIDKAVANKEADVKKAAEAMTGDETTSVAQYEAQKKDLEAQKEKIENLEGQKENVEKQIKTKKALIDKLENVDLPAAQEGLKKVEDTLEKTGIGSGATDVINDRASLDKEKAEYEASKSQVGANGKKRNFFQKMFGTNRSATQKAERAEYKAAKKEYKQSSQAYQQQFGYDPTNDAYQKRLKELGLIQ